MAEQRPGPPRKFGRGFAMICAGLLVLVPSGLCTGVVSVVSLVGVIGNSPSGYEIGVFWMSLMIGGAPILLGIALIFVGMRLNRS
jgi:hypothetical protein